MKWTLWLINNAVFLSVIHSTSKADSALKSGILLSLHTHTFTHLQSRNSQLKYTLKSLFLLVESYIFYSRSVTEWMLNSCMCVCGHYVCHLILKKWLSRFEIAALMPG